MASGGFALQPYLLAAQPRGLDLPPGSQKLMGRPPNPLWVTALAKETQWLPSALLVYTLSGRTLGRERLGLQALGLCLGLWGHWPNLPWGLSIPPCLQHAKV